MFTSLRYVCMKCALLHQRDITERRGGNKKENQSLGWVLSSVRGRLKPKRTDTICLFGANKQPGTKLFICEFTLHKLQKHIYSYYYTNIHICKQQQQDGDDNVVVWTPSIDVTNTVQLSGSGGFCGNNGPWFEVVWPAWVTFCSFPLQNDRTITGSSFKPSWMNTMGHDRLEVRCS